MTDKIWQELKDKLPWKKTTAHQQLRSKQWAAIDINRNGFVSLAEFDKAMLDVIQLPALFATKPVLLRAFNSAKTKSKSNSSKGDEYIEESEYRFLLKYIRQYYEYYVAFGRLDTDGDKKVTFAEFEKAAPFLKKWKIDVSDLNKQWAQCDSDGAGQVLFDEFASWAIKCNLDLDDDDDVTDSDIDPQEINRAKQNIKYLDDYKKTQAAKAKPGKKSYDNRIWAELKKKLPFENNGTDAKLREEQWRIMDNNNNGYISLAEFDKGLRDVIQLPILFETKPVILRAFTSAKNKVKSANSKGEDYVEKSEYRYLLKYMRQYYEYWVAFDLIDLDTDGRITFKEFELAKPQLQKWGIDMKDPKAQWKKCDADGFGKVLFDEFSNWAIKQSLDLDDDDDEADSDIEVKEIDRQAQSKKYLKQYKVEQARKNAHVAKKYDRSIWAELKKKLPWGKNAADEAKRNEQWKIIDNNGNGYVSLAEFQKGVRDVIVFPELFDIKPVMLRAYNAAKDTQKGKSRHSADYIEKGEYRTFLKYIRQYYEYWVAFDLIDADTDGKVSLKEFKQASPQLSQWGIDMSDPEAQFKKCDADGFGKVLFDEFANWAIKQSLDLKDDDDVTDSDIEVVAIDRQDQAKQRLKKYKEDKKAKEKEMKHATRKRYDNKIWDELKLKLPWEKTQEGKAQRIKIWRMIDINGNGIISLAELDKGMRDIIRLPQLFKTKPVMLRAFNAAKNKVKSKSRHGKDYVEKKEFRYLMKYLRQYYEYWVAFDLIDYDSDKRISFEEFKDAIPHLQRWGIDMSDPKAQWEQCDADRAGMVLFDEFCAWAIKKSLDLDDDDDVPDSDIDGKQVDRGQTGAKNIKKHADAKRKAQGNKGQKSRERSSEKQGLKGYDNSIWSELKRKLPWEKTATDRAQRISQWMQIDVNNNGLISLAELDKGMKDIIRLPQLFKTKPVMLRAFNAAKNKVKSDSRYGADYVERSEYRLLLKYLRQYFEYWIAFDQIDTDGDRRISVREFKYATPQLKRWGIDMSDPDAQWAQCDADGAGKILFDEFANWAIKQSLDLDDDDDVSEGELEEQTLERNQSLKYIEQYKKDQKAKEIARKKALKPQYDNRIWTELQIKLPYEKTDADRRARKKQWRQLDINGNGLVSLAELDKGMRDVIRIPLLFKTKPVMIRAFNAAKDKVQSKSKHGADYVEKSEYRFLLQYLRQYYEYWVAFDQIDLDSDRRLSLKEFEFAIPILKRWGIDMSDPKAKFRECDSDGKGMVLFDEFSDWAIKQNLALPEEDQKASIEALDAYRNESPQLLGGRANQSQRRIHASMSGLQASYNTASEAGLNTSRRTANRSPNQASQAYLLQNSQSIGSLGMGSMRSMAPSISVDQQIRMAGVRDLLAAHESKPNVGRSKGKYNAAEYASNIINAHATIALGGRGLSLPGLSKQHLPAFKDKEPSSRGGAGGLADSRAQGFSNSRQFAMNQSPPPPVYRTNQPSPGQRQAPNSVQHRPKVSLPNIPSITSPQALQQSRANRLQALDSRPIHRALMQKTNSIQKILPPQPISRVLF